MKTKRVKIGRMKPVARGKFFELPEEVQQMHTFCRLKMPIDYDDIMKVQTKYPEYFILPA